LPGLRLALFVHIQAMLQAVGKMPARNRVARDPSALPAILKRFGHPPLIVLRHATMLTDILSIVSIL
jgi:hypothetical protein